ncbi:MULTISPECIES: hypothetical protein [unclassified Bdellovibrio]|uniref:hypothetical protein n=1 Tax=unclassified Bdellovibrio TaxID=2633795 RepID=UPI001158314A|nr:MULTISPECIES: hypothetical protein [unclassified Bdellovibrio]QDK44016.1 hypothetical protein DOM22_01985 [Bdellovibrio sp. ZAP7]QLY25855.1 hypothetical protein HW988_02080 [Bdellovibrio sp. KM01]
MKKLLVLAATFAASSAFAGVKLEVRSDYVNTADYSAANGANVAGSSLFTPNVARLYLNGNVGEAVVESAWNLRSFEAFVDSTGDLHKNMTVDKFVDHLWAGKGMGAWMFKAGKLEVNTGGFERQKTLHGDTYLTSMANSGVGANSTATSSDVALIANPENSSGISAGYTITENHKLEAQVTNQTNTTTVDGGVRSTDKRHNMGLNYLGSFIDKMLVLNLNYTSGAGDVVGTGHEQSFTAASLRVAPMADLTIDLEYFGNVDKATTTATTIERKTNSTIVEARYNINGWIPVLKYEMSENKSDTASEQFKRDAFAVALEYVPKADEAFRYHVAYTSIKDKDFSTAGDSTKNVITVGFKYTGDMAK